MQWKDKIYKNNKIILLALYALIMFGTIINEIDTFTFIALFAIIPLAIYYFVKKIFPKEKKDEEKV